MAQSLFSFAIMMDRWTNEIKHECPWTMVFADDIVICNKTEFICVNEAGRWNGEVTGSSGGKIHALKYLGWTFQKSLSEKETMGRVEWVGKISRVICDKSSSKSERKVLQKDSETSDAAWK